METLNNVTIGAFALLWTGSILFFILQRKVKARGINDEKILKDYKDALSFRLSLESKISSTKEETEKWKRLKNRIVNKEEFKFINLKINEISREVELLLSLVARLKVQAAPIIRRRREIEEENRRRIQREAEARAEEERRRRRRSNSGGFGGGGSSGGFSGGGGRSSGGGASGGW